MGTISAARRDLLPFGSIVLAETLRQGQFKDVVFSALRRARRLSVLIDACRYPPDRSAADRNRGNGAVAGTLPATRRRSDRVLGQFSSRATGFTETDADVRLRVAACHLSDIGWRGHPDYRGEQSVDLIAFGSMTGINHPERAFLAEVLAVRYMGLKHKSANSAVMKLAGTEASRRARLLGAIFRLAYPLSAGMPGVLGRLSFVIDDNRLVLDIPREWEFLAGERIRNRLRALAEEAGFAGCGISTDKPEVPNGTSWISP